MTDALFTTTFEFKRSELTRICEAVRAGTMNQVVAELKAAGTVQVARVQAADLDEAARQVGR